MRWTTPFVGYTVIIAWSKVSWNIAGPQLTKRGSGECRRVVAVRWAGCRGDSSHLCCRKSWSHLLPMEALGGLARPVSTGALTLWTRENQYADQLSCHPGPDPGCWADPPQNFIIFKWLGHVKGPVLLIQSCRLSMTQDNPEEASMDPILILSQKLLFFSRTI